MNILLTGASGFIGHHILQALEQQDHKVTACFRHPEKLFFSSESTDILQLNYADMLDPASWSAHIETIDAVKYTCIFNLTLP